MFSRPWALWRRVQYLTGLFVVLGILGAGLYALYGYESPTCFDGAQNADERGIDCGGACQRICALDVQLPVALWSQSFLITDGQYNAVSYVENRNKGVGSPGLSYTFKLYDKEGLIVERSGVTVLPPDGVYPIFEGRILTGSRTPERTIIEFGDDVLWRQGDVGREQFTLERRELTNADSRPRLTAQLRNNALDEARDVEVIATIFDISGNPLTSSRTNLEYFAGRSTEEVVFTWPEPIAKTLRSCEIPTDVILAIDLSGSMNDDGGTPPEPISSVLTAAKRFVSQLNTSDQIGIATYATGASLTEVLTHESSRVSESVGALNIDPKEERGSTNTGEALVRMREELNSSRHNEDARKVAILLTDGLATAPGEDPEAFALQEADALKAAGVHVFTIGLGERANETFLRSIASTDAQYYKAPSRRDLDSIYLSITKDICEDGAAVIEIISKPETSFK
jgi:Mg-chelatase subunit ChlD